MSRLRLSDAVAGALSKNNIKAPYLTSGVAIEEIENNKEEEDTEMEDAEEKAAKEKAAKEADAAQLAQDLADALATKI